MFGCIKQRATIRLEQLADKLGVTPGGDGQTHCLISRIDSIDLIRDWLDRIEKIPDCFIDGVCAEAVELGINKKKADKAATFLKDRRTNLYKIVQANRDQLTSVKNWGTVL